MEVCHTLRECGGLGVKGWVGCAGLILAAGRAPDRCLCVVISGSAALPCEHAHQRGDHYSSTPSDSSLDQGLGRYPTPRALLSISTFMEPAACWTVLSDSVCVIAFDSRKLVLLWWVSSLAPKPTECPFQMWSDHNMLWPRTLGDCPSATSKGHSSAHGVWPSLAWPPLTPAVYSFCPSLPIVA